MPEHGISDGPWWVHRDCRIVMFSGHRDRVCNEVDLFDVDLRAPGAIWIHGGAKGFDSQVDTYARQHDIPVLAFPPDYKNYPPQDAPLVRNYRMLELADLVVLCYDDRPTGGTAYVFTHAMARKLPIHRVEPLLGR